jgi:putative nucleotidyltransferase with HDIG domain
MKRVLFVDDEPKLLDGLRRMLRVMRNDWEMEFAADGQEALAILDAKPFNVVVTDMRMPGMDGTELLNKIKDLHPQVVRIVLSGHSEKEMVLKTVGLAHQYLSKPCDADSLKATIARACSLRNLMDDEGLIQAVSEIRSLPSLPSLYSEVMKEMASPGGSLNRVGEIISRDTGMSAKILQLVNSAFFGLPTRISNPVRAVNLLGLETVKALVLSVKIFSEFSRAGSNYCRIDELWKHSISTALYARDIAREEKRSQDKIDDAFMAGLLHDVGKLILLDKFPEKCQKILELADSEKCHAWEAEQRLIGTTHARIGAYLLGIWGLSESIVETVAYHHSPHECVEANLTLATVYLANILSKEPSTSNLKKAMSGANGEYLEQFGISDRIETWRAVCDQASQGEDDALQDPVCG